MPPLRLVLNTACNGNCYFCHREGYNADNHEMSWSVINESIKAACQLNIPKISLTGGEPTLRKDLFDIVTTIKHKCPDLLIGLTTNGYKLDSLPSNAIELIDHINLSISSFNKQKYIRYQGVNPEYLLNILGNYASKTTINIVAVWDNKHELVSMIERCFSYGFSVDIMFDLNSNDIYFQKEVLSALTRRFGLFSIQYHSTPVMIQYEQGNMRLRIKAPSISNVLKRDICQNCTCYKICSEKICALRVYPDGTVSPCLNSYIQSAKESVFERIIELYPQLGISEEHLYDYFLSSE